MTQEAHITDKISGMCTILLIILIIFYYLFVFAFLHGGIDIGNLLPVKEPKEEIPNIHIASSTQK